MLNPAKILASLPDGLRGPLLQSYQEIARNYAEHRWEPSELNGGKFSEAAYSIIDGSIKGSFPYVAIGQSAEEGRKLQQMFRGLFNK